MGKRRKYGDIEYNKIVGPIPIYMVYQSCGKMCMHVYTLKNCWKNVYQNINSYPQWVSLLPQAVKNLPAVQETQVFSWVRKIPWRREWLPTPVFLPGEFHGQRSLAGYSPWGCKELDMNERLTLLLSSSMVGICAFMYFLAFLQ